MAAFRFGRVRLRLSWLPALVVALVAATVAGPTAEDAEARAGGFLRVALSDGQFNSPDEATRTLWLGRAVGAGASIIRSGVSWANVAPVTRPVGFRPTDPDDPAYRWENTDRAVRAAAAAGLDVFLTVTGAPRWATGAGSPADLRPGVWRPSARQFGHFAEALGRRYNGRFADPLRPGRFLPRVRYFEVWNEPNLDVYLAPQWIGRQAVAPALYRGLLNAFYAGVKKGNPQAKVIAGATAPYGDEPGGKRARPVMFLKRLLCLRKAGARQRPCRPRPRFDIYSHHSINVGAPVRSALDLRDASTPDLGRLQRVLRQAERQRLVLPRGRKPLWNTEMWWDTNPPDPDGVPLRRQARWIQQALWLTWRGGGSVATYFQFRDGAPVPDYPSTLQSGLYFLDGKPKPSLRGVRFPFVAWREGKGQGKQRSRINIWGIAPRAGKVRIERRTRSGWRRIRTLRTTGAPQTFVARLPLRRPSVLRATQPGGHTSLPWHQR